MPQNKLSIETLTQTPKSLGYSMPAEWQEHASTWLAWPHNLETWPDGRLEIVEDVYLQMLAALLPHEKVHLLIPSESHQQKILTELQNRNADVTNLVPHLIETVDAWIRDYGPTFLKSKDGQKAWCKWIFNAWGEKYESLMLDNKIFEEHASLISEARYVPGVVMEGGSIEVNGKGTCLVTKQCQLNPNRNPNLKQNEIEEILKESLGVSNIVWLNEGIVGDDTDGHIDDIARFVDERTILLAYEEDPQDENFALLNENFEILSESKDQDGESFNVIKLPMPGKVEAEGFRLPASYANFYIANKVVLLPVYDHPNDQKAIQILQDVFPSRKIVPISCAELVYGLGAIHCVTQQEPL